MTATREEDGDAENRSSIVTVLVRYQYKVPWLHHCVCVCVCLMGVMVCFWWNFLSGGKILSRREVALSKPIRHEAVEVFFSFNWKHVGGEKWESFTVRKSGCR